MQIQRRYVQWLGLVSKARKFHHRHCDTPHIGGHRHYSNIAGSTARYSAFPGPKIPKSCQNGTCAEVCTAEKLLVLAVVGSAWRVTAQQLLFSSCCEQSPLSLAKACMLCIPPVLLAFPPQTEERSWERGAVIWIHDFL